MSISKGNRFLVYMHEEKYKNISVLSDLPCTKMVARLVSMQIWLPTLLCFLVPQPVGMGEGVGYAVGSNPTPSGNRTPYP